jgi:hypothetical protein
MFLRSAVAPDATIHHQLPTMSDQESWTRLDSALVPLPRRRRTSPPSKRNSWHAEVDRFTKNMWLVLPFDSL